ncbi:MAG: site-specific DNA-methyltransferase, partial [Phycisphaerae bacterium]|nr:site-specific DNA-methyltransferase [Phycisphaerae bacterium]
MPTLDWIGKKAVVNHHREVPYRLLKAEPGLSVGDPGAGNLLVQGDNLQALKALLPYYAGQVKCIYIDPPYNTGNENWVYNDAVNAPEIKKWLGQTVGKEAEDLSRHDKWLCMMYPRLQLLHQMLREDGAIFISIDDNEHAMLVAMLYEIFGSQNHICSFVWQKKHTVANDARYVSDNHDFVVFFVKRRDSFKINKLPRTSIADARYTNPDNDTRSPWASGPCHAKTPNEKDIYEVTTPSGRKIWPPNGTSWRFSQSKFAALVADNQIWFGKKGDTVPRIKRFLTQVSDGMVSPTILTRDHVGDNQEGNQEASELLGKGRFASPKPTRLIERFLHLATDRSSLILDSFAGSGTTGHAVMKLNAADGGNRRFILVEMEENIARNITAERLKRVIPTFTSMPTGPGQETSKGAAPAPGFQ